MKHLFLILFVSFTTVYGQSNSKARGTISGNLMDKPFSNQFLPPLQ